MAFIDPDTVLEKVEQMRPTEAIDYLLGVVEACRNALSEQEHEIDTWGVHFTTAERRILSLLLYRAGRTVQHEALRSAIYAEDIVDEVPHSNVHTTHIHRLRRKIPTAVGQIVTVFQEGYKFVRS